MSIPSYRKRLTARRLWTVVMLKRRIAVKKLQQIAVDLHVKYFGGDKITNINSIGANFNDHYEFSCSSPPSFKSSNSGHCVNSGSGRNDLYGHFLLRALLSSCTRVNVKDDLDPESGNDDIPHFIACDEDDDQCSSYTDPEFSVNSDSNESSSDPFTSLSTTTCSNGCLSSEIDRQAEEFIATFYKQMRLQRQDSYENYQEMLVRGSS